MIIYLFRLFSMAKLEHLDISYNKLTFIPNEIKYMTRYICTKTNSLVLGRQMPKEAIEISSVIKLIHCFQIDPTLFFDISNLFSPVCLICTCII